MHFTPMTIRRTFLHAGAALALCLGNSLVAADLTTTALAKPAPPTGDTLFTSVPINNSGVELPPVMQATPAIQAPSHQSTKETESCGSPNEHTTAGSVSSYV